MHPIQLPPSHSARFIQLGLAAAALLGGLELTAAIGKRLTLAPERLWNLALVTLATYFCAARLLVIAANLRDFAAHPLWMLGLTTIRDERYTYSALALALAASTAYILAWRLPWRSVLDAAAPGAALALACFNLVALAAGADPGRPVSAWGIVSTSHAAQRVHGIPITLYTALVQVALVLLTTRMALQASRPGAAAASWLGATGLSTILLDQLRYPNPRELLVFGAFTPAQCLGIAATAAAAALWFSRAPVKRAQSGVHSP